MIITTKRRPLRYFFDVALTAGGWISFFIMFGAGIVALLRDETRGPDALFLPSKLTDSISTVAGYVVLMLCFTLFLIIWARYNQFRFAGVDRRKPPAPLSAAQLQTSFGVSEKQLDDMQSARFIVVAHDDDGAIRAIRTVDEALKMRALRRVHLDVPSPEVVAEPAQPPVKGSGNVVPPLAQKWSFLDPKYSVGYVSGTTWACQNNAYAR